MALGDYILIKSNGTTYDEKVVPATNGYVLSFDSSLNPIMVPMDAAFKTICIQLIPGSALLTIADGQAYIRVDASLNGKVITGLGASVVVKSTSGIPTFKIMRGRLSSPTSDFTYNEVTTNRITIDVNELDSKDATVAASINASYATLATGDMIRVDCTVAGTGTKCANITIKVS